MLPGHRWMIKRPLYALAAIRAGGAKVELVVWLSVFVYRHMRAAHLSKCPSSPDVQFALPHLTEWSVLCLFPRRVRRSVPQLLRAYPMWPLARLRWNPKVPAVRPSSVRTPGH